MANIPPIPVDIIASEILPRLPATSVLRCKCLNKFFYNHISSKDFTNLHLHHAVSSNSNRPLIVSTTVKEDRQCLHIADVDSPDSTSRYLSLPQPFCNKNKLINIVGSCHGMLCLTYQTDSRSRYYSIETIIINPSTGKVSSNISMRPYSTQFPTCTLIGFGYDRLNDDYKLVVVVYYYDDQLIKYSMVRVYSMKANSWRLVEGPCMQQVFTVLTGRRTCVVIRNSLLHWLLSYPFSRRKIIACFNVENEQWGAGLSLPFFESYNGGFNYDVDLGVLDGCLCLLVKNVERRWHDDYTLWIMKEYGVYESWTKVDIAIDRKYCPISANENVAQEQQVFLAKRKGMYGLIHDTTCEWYNVRSKTSKKFQLRDAPRDLEVELLCLGSLVTVLGDRQAKKRKATRELRPSTVWSTRRRE